MSASPTESRTPPPADEDGFSFVEDAAPEAPPPAKTSRRRKTKVPPVATLPAPAETPPAEFPSEMFESAPTAPESVEPEFRQAPAWFEVENARPEALWWVRLEGPVTWEGKRLVTGTINKPIHGRLTAEKIGDLVGTRSVCVTPDEPFGERKPRWYGPVEIATTDGRPKMGVETITAERAHIDDGLADIEKELKGLAAEVHAPPPDPEVEVYDPVLHELVKCRKSVAPAVQRKALPPAPAADPKLLELLKEQREAAKEQRDTNAAILKTLAAMVDRLTAGPPTSAMMPAGENPWKDMLALEQRRNDQALSDLRAEIRSLQSRSPGAEPVAMLGTILTAAKDLAGLAHGGGNPTGMAALSAVDKIIDRTSAALATVWPSAAPAFSQLLWNAAWAMPSAPAAPPLPPQPANGGQPAALPPPTAVPQPNPQEQVRMLEGMRAAIDLMGQVLDGKVSPEDAWSKIKTVAPPDAIAKIRTLASAAHVEIALSTIAQMPLLADKREVLLAAAKRATGDARAIAERFVAVVRAG